MWFQNVSKQASSRSAMCQADESLQHNLFFWYFFVFWKRFYSTFLPLYITLIIAINEKTIDMCVKMNCICYLPFSESISKILLVHIAIRSQYCFLQYLHWNWAQSFYTAPVYCNYLHLYQLMHSKLIFSYKYNNISFAIIFSKTYPGRKDGAN